MDRLENTVHFCIPVISGRTCLFVKALLSNGCIYLLIKNLLPRSGCCFIFVSRLLPSNGPTCYIAPSLRLFVPNSPQAYHLSFFSEGCACDVCGWSHISPLWLSSHGDYSSTAPTARTLRLLIPSGSLIGCQSVQVFPHHASLPFGEGKSSRNGHCSYTFSSYSMCSLFFPFRGG
jgi:hypothetical protein